MGQMFLVHDHVLLHLAQIIVVSRMESFADRVLALYQPIYCKGCKGRRPGNEGYEKLLWK